MECDQSVDSVVPDGSSLGFDHKEGKKTEESTTTETNLFENVQPLSSCPDLVQQEPVRAKMAQVRTVQHTFHVTEQLHQRMKAGDKFDSSPTAPQYPVLQGHHHPMHGNSLRSDTYLRQALTSPYNQCMEKHSASGLGYSDSGGQKAMPVHSPSQYPEKDLQMVNSPHPDNGKWVLHEDTRRCPIEGSSGIDHHFVFKTPKNSIWSVFSTPDKGRKGKDPCWSSSSSSSASGSSGSGRYPHHNPFDQGHDRMHFPAFSPNMFHAPETPGSSESELFQWNVEHVAELRPVHIDDRDIRRQMSKQNYDRETEQRAQKAIDYYFQHHMVAPSPWSEVPPPHVLPVTPAYAQDGENLMAETQDQAQGSIQKDLTRSRKTVDGSCQTKLTIPTDVDLEECLGNYMTYQDSDRNDSNSRESLSSSTLRRKLFFNADSSSVFSPVKSGQRSPDHLSAALCTPPNFQKTTPEWERGSPIDTPSSVQFSSSPIRGLMCSGDCHRSSFSDTYHLASPEVSPIVERKRGARTRQALVFPSSSSCDTEKESRIGFGSPCHQQQQMEVHDGNSLIGRPSPNMSPIAVFGPGESDHQSRSQTLRADPSQFVFCSPLHPMPSSPSVTMPFSTLIDSNASPRHLASIYVDQREGSVPLSNDVGTVNPGDASMMDVMLVNEGTSELEHDSLQPPSCSNLDTGYQTGSGSGSLQTTQEGGASMTASADGGGAHPHTDTSNQLKRLATKLHSSMSERAREPVADARAASGEENGVDQLESCVNARVTALHTNLTTQFMSMPVGCRLPSVSGDPEAVPLSVKDAVDSSGEKPRKSNRLWVGLDPGTPMTIKRDPFTSSKAAVKRFVRPKGNNPNSDGEECRGHDAYLYEHSAEFLQMMGDYLEKGGESSDEKSDKGSESTGPDTFKTSLMVREKADRENVESVMQHNKHYQASSVAGQEGSRGQLGRKITPGDWGLTPSKQLLGKVVEDLMLERGHQSSPALASEVAKEIMRRAKRDLRQLDGSSNNQRTHSS